jgi:hypothetical protein
MSASSNLGKNCGCLGKKPYTRTSVVYLSSVLAVAAMVFVPQCHAQLSLNFASNTGAFIEFGGTNHTFTFNNAANGYQWNIGSESPGHTAAIGLLGQVNNGPFSYGPISLSNGGNVQTANVLGPLGTLVINDGGMVLTGQVNWVNVTTLFQSAGVFNAQLNVNVANIVYSGANTDLQYLTANQPATMDLTFQFSPGMNLTMLSSGPGGYDTSYSGSISVPEPTMLALSGLGGLGLFFLRRRQR